METENGWFERLDELFTAFVQEDDERFLDGCCDDLTLNVRGTAGLATFVPKVGIPGWRRSTQQLAEASSPRRSASFW